MFINIYGKSLPCRPGSQVSQGTSASECTPQWRRAGRFQPCSAAPGRRIQWGEDKPEINHGSTMDKPWINHFSCSSEIQLQVLQDSKAEPATAPPAPPAPRHGLRLGLFPQVLISLQHRAPQLIHQISHLHRHHKWHSQGQWLPERITNVTCSNMSLEKLGIQQKNMWCVYTYIYIYRYRSLA